MFGKRRRTRPLIGATVTAVSALLLVNAGAASAHADSWIQYYSGSAQPSITYFTGGQSYKTSSKTVLTDAGALSIFYIYACTSGQACGVNTGNTAQTNHPRVYANSSAKYRCDVCQSSDRQRMVATFYGMPWSGLAVASAEKTTASDPKRLLSGFSRVATAQDRLPRFLTAGERAVPDLDQATARFVGSNDQAKYWQVMNRSGSVCLVSVLGDDDRTTGIGCTEPAAFAASGVGGYVESPSLLAEAYLIPDGYAESARSEGLTVIGPNLVTGVSQQDIRLSKRSANVGESSTASEQSTFNLRTVEIDSQFGH